VRSYRRSWFAPAARSGRAGAQLYWAVVLPAALPGILTGHAARLDLRLARLDGRELLASSGGLGARLIEGKKTGNLARCWR